MNIQELNLPARTNNALLEAGLTTAQELQKADLKWLALRRNMGTVGIQDSARALLAHGLSPYWLHAAAPGFEYEPIPWREEWDSSTSPDGWRRITDFYIQKEYWMLENAIGCLAAGNIPWAVISGKGTELALCRKGGVSLEAE